MDRLFCIRRRAIIRSCREEKKAMKNNKTKRYSEAFKKEAVLRVIDGRFSSNKISKDLGVSQTALSRWVKSFKQSGSSFLNKESAAAFKKLQMENKRLKAERDILKKAVTFFAGQEE